MKKKLNLSKKSSLTLSAKRLPTLALLAAKAGLGSMTYQAWKIYRSEGSEQLPAKLLGEWLVRFFQDSGPVLTKLGQILSTRPDLLSVSTCKRLEVLYSRQKPMSRKEIETLLMRNYGKNSPFTDFSHVALGVGSVGQVHRAQLETGEKVIVKLIRTGCQELIEQDLATLRTVLRTYFYLCRQQNSPAESMVLHMLESLETGFINELDLRLEAKSAQRFRELLRSNKQIYVPKVYSHLSGREILVIEELKGIPLAQWSAGKKDAAFERKAYAEKVLREVLRQIFSEGFFHADPHAGNIFVLDDGRLGLIDFGLTGEFTREHRKAIGKAVKGMIAKDADAMIEALLEFGTIPSDFDLPGFREEIVLAAKKAKDLLENSGQNLDLLVNDLLAVAYKHNLFIPQSTTLLIKTLVTIEGVARSLDPDIKLVSVAAPVVLQSLTPKWLRWPLFRN